MRKGMRIVSLIHHLPKSKSRIKASKKKICILMLILPYVIFLFLMCAKVQGGERLGKMPKGYDHLKNNKFFSLTSCPKDALSSEDFFLVGLMAICIFMNCQTWLPKVMILRQWDYDKKMTKRSDSVLEAFICIVRKCEEFEIIGNENRHKISILKLQLCDITYLFCITILSLSKINWNEWTGCYQIGVLNCKSFL